MLSLFSSIISNFFEFKFVQYSNSSTSSLNERPYIFVIVVPSLPIFNTTPFPVGLRALVSGLYSYSFVANTYHSFLYLNLLPYPSNTVPFLTISGFISIVMSSVISGGGGIGVGIG